MPLKTFIHFVGAILLLLGSGLIVASILGYLGHGAFSPIFLLGALLLSMMGGLIAWVGWRLFRRWDRAVVGEYADIQALLTGIVLAQTADLFLPHAFFTNALVAFLVIRPWLRRLLLDVLNMSHEP